MVKEKPNSTRIYDADGFKRRAACICVKNDSEDQRVTWNTHETWNIFTVDDNQKYVLMVTSSKRPDQWIFPGGGVEPAEDSSVTAVREVVEEAGVTGKLDRFLGIFEVRNIERKHRTEVFVMIVSEELPEWEDSIRIGRQRKWFTVEDALKHLRLHKPVQLTYLETLLTCNRRLNK